MEESISLEETNKIRISLGLKPLTDDKAPADNKEKEEPAARGNEWEVVSLTASTYAAAQNSEQVNVTDDENVNTVAENETAETSRARPSLIILELFGSTSEP